MKLLVVGHEGQLARSLIEQGRDRDQLELITVARPDLDLECPGSGRDAVLAIRPDLVINAAAYTAVDRAEDEPERALRINGEAPGELAAAAREIGAKIIHISTDYVFDGAAEGPYDEEAQPGPVGRYGESKLIGEARVREENPNHLIIRTAWVFSPFGQNFLKTMLSAAAVRDQLKVVSDQFGNPTSALDLARGLLAAVERIADHDGSAGQTYNLAGTGEASWFEFASNIFEQSAQFGGRVPTITPIRTEEWPTRAVRPKNSRLNCAKFSRAFDFTMPHWRDSTRDVISRIARQPGGR
jgi:dTDP-4-dehydrorhamnose reductase